MKNAPFIIKNKY